MSADPISFQQFVANVGNSVSSAQHEQRITHVDFNGARISVVSSEGIPVDKRINLAAGKKPKAAERVLTTAMTSAAAGKKVLLSVERVGINSVQAILQKLETN